MKSCVLADDYTGDIVADKFGGVHTISSRTMANIRGNMMADIHAGVHGLPSLPSLVPSRSDADL